MWNAAQRGDLNHRVAQGAELGKAPCVPNKPITQLPNNPFPFRALLLYRIVHQAHEEDVATLRIHDEKDEGAIKNQSKWWCRNSSTTTTNCCYSSGDSTLLVDIDMRFLANHVYPYPTLDSAEIC